MLDSAGPGAEDKAEMSNVVTGSSQVCTPPVGAYFIVADHVVKCGQVPSANDFTQHLSLNTGPTAKCSISSLPLVLIMFSGIKLCSLPPCVNHWYAMSVSGLLKHTSACPTNKTELVKVSS